MPLTTYKIEFTGQFKPSLLRVGQKLVIDLTIKNLENQSFRLDHIWTDGPWDKFTTVNVIPGGGKIDCGWFGCTIPVGFPVGPNAIVHVQIVTYPNEPGGHEFSFIAKAADGKKLVGTDGQEPVIGGTVNVIR